MQSLGALRSQLRAKRIMLEEAPPAVLVHSPCLGLGDIVIKRSHEKQGA
jgi:hypothetical protein